jgi:hypothetical protein
MSAPERAARQFGESLREVPSALARGATLTAISVTGRERLTLWPSPPSATPRPRQAKPTYAPRN